MWISEFIWNFGKLPFPSRLGKYFNKIGKISAKIHEIGKIKAIFGLGMTPIYGFKNGQIKSLWMDGEICKLCHFWMKSIWASMLENLSLRFANNKSADQPTQHDQRLCYSLFGKYNT